MAPTQQQTIHLAPAPVAAPECIRCSRPTTLRTTRYSNRNGNAGRPYYKCIPCDRFTVFADERGNDPQNPLCHCAKSSKRQLAGSKAKKSTKGAVHYVCRLGRCDYYFAQKDAQGKQVVVEEDLVDKLAKLSFV